VSGQDQPVSPATAAPGAISNATANPGSVTKVSRTAAPKAGKSGPPATVVTSEGGGPPKANLFAPNEDTIGITKDKIVMCGHAATTFGPAFNTSEQDLNVYWEMVSKEQGGVYGRQVEITFENDNYDPATAIQAAQACKQKNPFVLLGGIGFDQIPAVRKFAEDNHMFYFHHIAIEDVTKRFSFTALPSVERVGYLAGEWVGHHHPGKRIGVIYRNSENWDPGRQAFLKRLKELGGNVVAQVPVEKNQGNYANALVEMTGKGAQVVFAWENALAQTAMIQQAKAQNYSPQWVVFPFNIVTDALGDQAMSPPLEGIAAWTAFSPGDYSGPFESYAAEIKKFEAAYAKYRAGTQVTDIHWQVWLAWKYLHQLLLQCGKDCTRNKLAGLIITAKNQGDFPLVCPIDFTRNGHIGSTALNMLEAYRRPNGNVGWRHMPGQVCKDAF
jgi:ABC-type branched-subunit amino acid transport system substrate-binding protein